MSAARCRRAVDYNLIPILYYSIRENVQLLPRFSTELSRYRSCATPQAYCFQLAALKIGYEACPAQKTLPGKPSRDEDIPYPCLLDIMSAWQSVKYLNPWERE